MNELIVDSITDEERRRLFRRIVVDTVTGCWNWIGNKIPKGYGTCTFRGRHEYVHRVLFAERNGPLPRGRKATALAQIDHVCKNTSCCNPDHMELVTRRENILRSGGFAGVNFNKTHCIRGHLLPERQPGKYRQCKQCKKITDRAKRERQLSGQDRVLILQKDRDAKRAYRAQHPEKARQAWQRYGENHREEIKQRVAAYRKANRDKINERQRINRANRLAKAALSHE